MCLWERSQNDLVDYLVDQLFSDYCYLDLERQDLQPQRSVLSIQMAALRERWVDFDMADRTGCIHLRGAVQLVSRLGLRF